MMFSYPFPYYNRYSRYRYHYPNHSSYSNKNLKKQEYANTTNNNINNVNQICNEPKKEECSSSFDDSPLFQIFGINLYFDDILIICLIFFLYQEGVKDESLFIALILLLLS